MQVRGRVRRRPALLALLVVGLGGAALIVALQARPAGSSPTALALQDGYVGTTYAFDGAVCLGSSTLGAEVLGVEVEQSGGSTTRLVVPPAGAAPTLGFPAPDEGREPVGYALPAGGDDCTLRLLVTPDRQGALRPGTVRVRLGYGPLGLLRRTVEVRPQVSLQVTGVGEDPRAAARTP